MFGGVKWLKSLFMNSREEISAPVNNPLLLPPNYQQNPAVALPVGQPNMSGNFVYPLHYPFPPYNVPPVPPPGFGAQPHFQFPYYPHGYYPTLNLHSGHQIPLSTHAQAPLENQAMKPAANSDIRMANFTGTMSAGLPANFNLNTHQQELHKTSGVQQTTTQQIAPAPQSQESKNIDEESTDWPQGFVHREYPVGTEPPKWNRTKWQWHSNGHTNIDGRRAEVRTCLGVILCSNPACQRATRPKTNGAARSLQVQEPCSIKTCRSQLTAVTCNVKTYHFRTARDGVAYSVWEHNGNHLHARPPGGTLSLSEQVAVDDQVIRRAGASAHTLRTGDIIPGSVPLAEISSTLANPRAARYQVAQSQARLGITSSVSAKGGSSVLSALAGLREEFKTPFIINSAIHGPTYLMFQTPFMKRLLEESIVNWNTDSGDGPDAARHGMVTDGDHTFFNDGILNVTCIFSTVMSAWVPVLYTWILGQDIEHHRPHFQHINQSQGQNHGPYRRQRNLFPSRPHRTQISQQLQSLSLKNHQRPLAS
ncbi:hypothetical protein GALMADRAFT_152034 [Galerina marginata CBS 339.88]|uniref:GCM domain-containing protein n=1 Tax=Galerina marginata (strain CBS 339.88) TaxID=685588 RepID=A0A067TIU1_GALM3|nr:hypothetical protein GALMADRAFT_152034 [Galerina marginata CBS 339.88]